MAAVERALNILNCFDSEKDKLQLREIAEITGFYKSTILRLAGSLERFGYLSRLDDGSYTLGPTLWRLGSIYRRRFNFAEQIRPVLRRLSNETSESASFYIRDGNSRVCLFRHNGPQAIRHHLDEGIQLPLTQGAASHLLKAHTDGSGQQKAKILQNGYAISLGERNPDTASIAVPVFGASGKFSGALVISGLLSRFDEDKRHTAIDLAKQEAQELGPRLITD